MIGEKIVHRREELGLTQVQLSKMCGIKAPTLNNYEKNKTFPNEENLFRLMKALKCDANYLFGSTITAESFTLTEWERISVKKFRTLDKYGKNTIATMIDLEYKRCKKMRHVRKPEIIQIKMSPFAVSAGTGVGLDDEYYETLDVKASAITRQADYAVRVSGDSMQPTFYDGDIILVESMPQINIGDIGVFIVDGDGFVKELGNGRLISHNEKYSDIILKHHDMVFCSGRVIGVLEEDDFV